MADMTSNREREHAERMLKRAQRHRARAEKLVAKWQMKIANLDGAGVAAVQPRLWTEESDPRYRQPRYTQIPDRNQDCLHRSPRCGIAVRTPSSVLLQFTASLIARTGTSPAGVGLRTESHKYLLSPFKTPQIILGLKGSILPA
jgi:hypothetical protein